MINLKKFYQALVFIKAGGCWSMGLIIGDVKDAELDLIGSKSQVILIGTGATDLAIKKMVKTFQTGEWLILKVKKELPNDIYRQLKLLSDQNRLELKTGEYLLQPDTVRVVVVASLKTVREIEKSYPDFKYLFGPVIII